MEHNAVADQTSFTVLIVDDVPKNIQVVANVLGQQGYKLLFSQSGAKAIQIVQTKSVDLILLDIMMPEMDGYEVCHQIKQIPGKSGIPVLFLTAKNDIDSITKGFKAGGIDFITKPFNNDELKARVENHLKMRQAFKIIQQQNEELTALNETKDKFFSIIAHDLRNPFNAIFMMTEVLNRKVAEMDKLELGRMVELLFMSSKEIRELLDNLLTWSKLQRNKLEYLPENLNIKEVVLGNIALYDSIAKSKNIELVYQCHEGIEVFSDKNMLNTILRNLLTNAIKFTHDGGDVSVSVQEKEKEILFLVKDNGVGMSSHEAEKILSHDRIIPKLGTSDERGTGIGLTLCMEFIEKLNGRLWVETELNKGSSFFFTIGK
jgi:two-component system, sensor histidine kinase and response regulator